MDTAKILAVADAVEMDAIPNMKFQMASAMNTSDDIGVYNACLAVYAILMLLPNVTPQNFWGVIGGNGVQKTATELLGISEEQGGELFFPDDGYIGKGRVAAYDATPQQAATVMRNLAETGAVDWNRVMESA